MPDVSQWDRKIHKPAKFGDPFDWRTVKGQEWAQLPEWRRRYAEARIADELDRLEWEFKPWPVKVIVVIVEGLLWPFQTFKRLRD
jgi:hypothetical protein